MTPRRSLRDTFTYMNNKDFSDIIKKELIKHSITQAEFARIMKVSLPTMKRWLNGNGVLLKDWVIMLEYLELSLSEVATRLGEVQKRTFCYTLKQEEAFAKEEGLLAFFDQLLKGKTHKQISRLFSLDEISIIFYLSKLDRIGLIEWQAGNKIKLLVDGEPSWIENGPLAKKFRMQIIEGHCNKYLDKRKHLKLNLYSLSETSIQKLSLLLDEVSDRTRILELKDQNLDNTKLTTLILGYGLNDIPILTKIPKRLSK